MTLAEFCELLAQKDFCYKMWIKEWQNPRDCHDSRDWESHSVDPISESLILSFARAMQTIIITRLSLISSEEFYEETRKTGHAFLREIHAIAQAQGIEVELEKIDAPLTGTEAMVNTGMVKVEDGCVSLTEAGEQAAQAVEDQIKGLNQPEQGGGE